MKIVLLSEGASKRLLKNEDEHPLTLQPVLASPKSKQESMVQRLWRQIGQADLQKDTLVVTNSKQAQLLQSQFGEQANVIIAPHRHHTYAETLLAVSHLYSEAQVGLSEIIIVLPADLVVEDAFFSILEQLEVTLRTSKQDLALLGMRPTHPSEDFGYIIPSETYHHEFQPAYINVSQFVNRPRTSEAQALLEQNALWSCGVFAFQLNYMIHHMIHYELPIRQVQLQKQYHRIPRISFDEAVTEQARNVVVKPYHPARIGQWVRRAVIGQSLGSVRSSLKTGGTIV
ncbi:sugar phosphate nucleotidyltransferase [Paenibacillus turpanensis]|uniref:sugar phosphate nucleotidyltransferase n=1 Tax=Paenibacillus turpanensis TaxID=2689078 RepID=UPI00140B925D|nr:sugar phosphate nucleotidyltransferase [Paenibacillus turpanensis]